MGLEDSFWAQYLGKTVLVEYPGSSLAIAVPYTFHIGVPVHKPKYGFLLGDIFEDLHFGAIGTSLYLDPVTCLELSYHEQTVFNTEQSDSGHLVEPSVRCFPIGKAHLQ